MISRDQRTAAALADGEMHPSAPDPDAVRMGTAIES